MHSTKSSRLHSGKKDFVNLLILLCCCLIAWWPLTFHLFSLKNDALNYHLAIRYQISENIFNGHLPFWTPYLNLGYPLHGDMQSGVWSPVVQFLSLFGPYTLKTLQCELLLYVYLSGAGMFFLLRYFFENRAICLLGAAAYMLSGYMTDSAQFLNWISAASFLPFLFLFYYRTITEKNWKTALWGGIFYFLVFTSAYPADFILTSYLLLFLLIWQVTPKQNHSGKNLWKLVRLNALFGVSFLLLSLPAIISYAEFLPLTERGSGATYEQAMTNYFHPGLLISFLAPLPVWKASFAMVTDPLERNCFLGLIPFTFLAVAFFIKSNHRFERFSKWGFFLSLLFTLGPLGGLRATSYYLLPLMNTFRHAANARLFFIFFGCILAAFSIDQLIKDPNKSRIRKYGWMALLACYAGLLVWSFSSQITLFSYHNFIINAQGIKLFLDHLNFSNLLLFDVVLQLPFLVLLYFWFVRKMNLKGLVITGLINLVIHAALYQPFSAIKKDRVYSIQHILDTIQPRGFPTPDLNRSLAENSEGADAYFDAIGSYMMYSKKIGRVHYKFTPSNLLTQNEFWLNEKMRNILFHYPFFYRADTVVSIEDSARLSSTQKKIVLIKNRQIKNFLNTDSLSSYTALIKNFTPLGWTIEIKSNEPAFYSVFQNGYPRWQLFIDGKKEPIEPCNISFMGFLLPAGKHLVSFAYKINDLLAAYFISCCTLLIMLALLLIHKKPPSQLKYKIQ